MKVRSIHLTNFRSYSDARFIVPDNNIQVLYGNNGAGKTNILEALCIGSLTKSPIAKADEEVVRFTTPAFRVELEAIDDANEMQTVTVALQVEPQRRKLLQHNGLSVNSKDLLGVIPSVTFLPSDLDLFTGAPAARRTYINQLLCQVSPEYTMQLLQYQHVLKQRNTLLRLIVKGQGSTADLPVWNTELARLGALITVKRIGLLEQWQQLLEERLQSLGERWTNIELRYLRKGTAVAEAEIQSELQDLLTERTQRDILLATTSIGPHRDDIELAIDGHPIATFASRGQQRTAVLALLFLQASYIELCRNERPIVLLDDVFSELDDAHQANVLTTLKAHQVWITTAHSPPSQKNYTLWRVNDGQVQIEE